jgi:hypothetical protein
VAPQKIRNRIFIGTNNSPSGYMPKRTESGDTNRYYIPMAALFTIAKSEASEMSLST